MSHNTEKQPEETEEISERIHLNTMDGNQPPTGDKRSRRGEEIMEGIVICLREVAGTAIYTYVGCLNYSNSPYVGFNFFSQGLTYTVLQASSDLSSCGGLHLNPVITLAALIAGKIKKPLLVIPMILAQFIGSLIGAGLYRASLPKHSFISAEPPQSAVRKTLKGEYLVQHCFVELVLTCILVKVFLKLMPVSDGSSSRPQPQMISTEMQKYIHAIFVGLTITAITFGSFMLNPFRAFAPMAAWVAEAGDTKTQEDSNLWKGHWVYWIGPLIGAVIVGTRERLKGSSCWPKRNRGETAIEAEARNRYMERQHMGYPVEHHETAIEAEARRRYMQQQQQQNIGYPVGVSEQI